MDTYKLTYFNLRGIAEPIRLMFNYAGVSFEDHQIDCNSWTEVQNSFKWQKLPLLEYNGKVLTQSVAISRFLAGKFNLKPDDPWDSAKCDEIVGAINDLRLHVKPLVLAKMGKTGDEGELAEELHASSVPLYLQNINDILNELRVNNPENGDYVFGGCVTWVDFWLAHFTDQWSDILEDPHLLDKYSLLKNQQCAVYGLPGVAKWIKERPKSFI